MDARPLFEKLTRLILSLSVTQKRNFKIYVKTYSDQESPRYIRLFDFINKITAEPEFDGNITAIVTQKKVLRIHEMSQVANYLYYKILESMRQMPETHKARIEIVRILQDCRFLISKEMFDEAWKEILKAKELLQQQDYPELELEVTLLERRLNGSWQRENMGQRLTEVHNKVDQVLKRLQKDNEVFYQNIHLLQSFVSSSPLPSEVSVNTHRYILELKSDNLPFGIKYRMLLAIANYHRLLPPEPTPIPPLELVYPSKEDEYAHLLQLVQLMDKNRGQVKEDPSNFLEILVRYLSSAIDLGHWDDFYRHSLQLEHYQGTIEFYRNATYIYLLAFIRKGQFEAAEAFISEHRINEKIFQPRYHIRPSRLATICFYCAVIYLSRKKSEPALFWLEKIIEHKPADSMPGLRCTAYMMRILVIAHSPVLSGKYNTARLLVLFQRWYADRIDDKTSRIELCLQILDYFCQDDQNLLRVQTIAVLDQLKKALTLKQSNDQIDIFAALAESYLQGKAFEETVRPYL
ncbi:MAG: hypothetical protein SFV22_08840 [Saprospiraceae bacterium]|nr:hypothetical protein [Saprospiraceae bacterium]